MICRTEHAKAKFVVRLIVDLVLTERHVADSEVIKITAISGLKARHGNVSLRVQLFGDASGDAVQFHTVQPTVLHAVLFGIAFQTTDAGLADLHAGHAPVLPQQSSDALLALGRLGLVQPKRRLYCPQDSPGRQLGGGDHNVE